MASSIPENSSRHKTDLWREQPELCSKCGKCRSVCPVFRETRDETYVARGRLALIGAASRGELSPNGKTFVQSLSTCIGCYRCVYECPSGIEVVDAVHCARSLWPKSDGIGRAVKLMLRYVVPHRRLYDTAIRVASVAQKVLPGAERPPLRHLPLLMMDSRRVPGLASRSFLKSVRGKQFNVPDAGRQVVFFVGCMINYVYPEIGHALVRLLNRRGVSVIIPRNQVCCGTPALSVGDERAADKLRKRNINALFSTGATDIVCACASGTKTLKHDLVAHLDSRRRERIRVYDATEYIHGILPSLPNTSRLDLKVTYHDPCHLRWGQDISVAPREMLRSVCDYEEMSGAEECCGFGGTFNLLHYDLSQRIAARKADSIAGTRSEVVATACPGCIMQLQTIIAEHGLNREVRHVVELLEEAERRAEADRRGELHVSE